MKRGMAKIDALVLSLQQAIVIPSGRPAGSIGFRLMAGLLARGFPPVVAFPGTPKGSSSGLLANGYSLTVAGAAAAWMLKHRTAFPIIPIHGEPSRPLVESDSRRVKVV
jgi:hypothetical protein